MAAVFVADDTDRLERLTRHVSSDFVYVSPEAVFEGAAGLSEAFARFRREPRWQTTLRRTSPVEVHHGYFRLLVGAGRAGRHRGRGLELRLARRRGVHLPGGDVRGIGARPTRRPIMRARPRGRDADAGARRGGRRGGHGHLEPPRGAQRAVGRAAERARRRDHRPRRPRGRGLHGADGGRPGLLRRRRPEVTVDRAADGPAGPHARPGHALRHAAAAPDAGHRRHQRPDGDRRAGAGPVLRLPHRVGTGALRRHPRPRRASCPVAA